MLLVNPTHVSKEHSAAQRRRTISLSDGRHRPKPRVVALLGAALFTATFPIDAAAVEPTHRRATRATVQWSSGYATGMGADERVHQVQSGLGADYRWSAALGVGAEAALVHFVGERDARSVSRVGVTLLPVLAWHFWRGDSSSLAIELGVGGGFFIGALPVRSAALSDYWGLGLQARLALRRDVQLLIGVRVVHHTSFRGSDHPAFDGVAFNLGTAFGLSR